MPVITREKRNKIKVGNEVLMNASNVTRQIAYDASSSPLCFMDFLYLLTHKKVVVGHEFPKCIVICVQFFVYSFLNHKSKL